MDYKQVVIVLRDHSAEKEKPLMLQPILFCPVLTWVCQELLVCGVQRFFIVCDERWQAETRAATKTIAGVELFTELPAALTQAQGSVLVIPCAVLPLTGGESPVYVCDAAALGQEKGALLPARPASARTQDGWTEVSSAVELSRAMPRCRDMLCDRFIEQGVTIVDTAATYIDPRVSVAPGTVLLPGTILRGYTTIGRDCEIGPNSMIRDCMVGDDTTVNASQLNESVIGSHTTVGPFAYVRPDCRVGDHCRIGDFVELKNSCLGDGTKVSHLTYVGDSDVGQRVNFGCGTVTTNYNGLHKYRCTVGDDVFLGCNTNLIAPVRVGDGAYTAAGSTITDDVPEGALGIARARQVNKDGWAGRFFKDKK